MKESWVNLFLNSVIDVWMQEFRLSLQKRRLITSTECLLEGEVSVSIADGGGRTIAQGMYDKNDWALDNYSLVTWNTVVHDTIVNELLETKSISALNF